MIMRTKIFFAVVAAAAALCACEKGVYKDMNVDGPFAGNYDEGIPQDSQGGDKYDDFDDNPFITTEEEPTSTFSVDCDGASYANMRRFIREGQLPPKSAVRIEEFLNYFTFDYAEPKGDEMIALNSEVSACPWNENHRLMRLGIKGKSLKNRPNSNFVLLVDVSGSMNSEDKIELLKSSFCTLVDNMDPKDRVSIITYASGVKKVLESTLASDGVQIKNALRSLQASGATSGADALTMGYQEAEENFIKGGNNRIIMGTDGDFNVGVTSTEGLIEIVENYAKKGIYITICGFGRGNLNDSMIEKVTNAGNGTYEYIDSEDEVTKVFVNDYGKFFAVANDVKIQINFDAEQVEKYRLIGYENRVLSEEEFEDDKTDASEIGAGQTITALYELVPAEKYAAGSECAKFSVRYKKALGENSILIEDSVKSSNDVVSTANMSFAAGTAAYGMILRESPHKGSSSFELATNLIDASLSFDPHGYRTQFKGLIDLASKID